MPSALLPRAIALAALATAASAQTLLRSVNGPSAGLQFGQACIVVPDQNADGVEDLLVGAPGFNQSRGAIYCVSGAYLALGAGQQLLWSLAPSALAGDRFGASICDVGDVTGDAVHDFLVGQPGYDSVGPDGGAVRLVNGATRVAVSLIFGFETGCKFGAAAASCADSNGNGKREIAISGPGPTSNSSRVYWLDGAVLTTSNSVDVLSYGGIAAPGSQQLGAALAGGFDHDGDGRGEFIVGAPGVANGPLSNAGRVILFETTTIGMNFVGDFISPVGGERLGSSVDGGYDYDGDGFTDIVAGAPNSPDSLGGEAGRVVALSGARVASGTPPFELFAVGPIGAGNDDHFGTTVKACADLNGDGVGDVLGGAPDFVTQIGGLFRRGQVKVSSGASGALWCAINGFSNDQIGSAIAGALADLDGDGYLEYVFAGALSDVNGTDSGVLKCYGLFPLAPSVYCTGKINSQGCTPAIAFTGSPSASSGAPFTITASNVLNQKTGLLFYSSRPNSALFQGGLKCVADPSIRTPPQGSGGAPSGSNCSGAYAFDFNAWTASGFDLSLGAGAEVFAQYWARDPASPSHTSLSNALRFVINP